MSANPKVDVGVVMTNSFLEILNPLGEPVDLLTENKEIDAFALCLPLLETAVMNHAARTGRRQFAL